MAVCDIHVCILIKGGGFYQTVVDFWEIKKYCTVIFYFFKTTLTLLMPCFIR